MPQNPRKKIEDVFKQAQQEAQRKNKSQRDKIQAELERQHKMVEEASLRLHRITDPKIMALNMALKYNWGWNERELRYNPPELYQNPPQKTTKIPSITQSRVNFKTKRVKLPTFNDTLASIEKEFNQSAQQYFLDDSLKEVATGFLEEYKAKENRDQAILNTKLMQYEINKIHLDTGTPFTQEERERIITWFKNNPNEIKYKRDKNGGFPSYSILKIKSQANNSVDQYMIIYRGKKHNTALGKGTYGRVKLAQDLNTGKVLVAKIIEKSHLGPNVAKIILREKTLLQQNQELQGVATIKAKEKEYLMMNFKEGVTLHKYLLSSKSDLEKLKAILKALQATKTLHSKGIIHGDLSFHNILYDDNNNAAEIIDFGFADMANSRGYIEPIFQWNWDPFSYYPKESSQGKHFYSSDTYSLGYFLAWHVRKTSFKNEEVKTKITNIANSMKALTHTDRLSIDDAINRITQLILNLSHDNSTDINPTHSNNRFNLGR